jgi:hypothetical protein
MFKKNKSGFKTVKYNKKERVIEKEFPIVGLHTKSDLLETERWNYEKKVLYTYRTLGSDRYYRNFGFNATASAE